MQNPDSLFLLYIAFLAFDFYAGSHGRVTQVESPRIVPTQDAATQVSEIVTIAHTFVDQLIKEAGTSLEDLENTEIKTGLASIVEEM